MGKSGICKLPTLAILSGDVSNTALSNCGNMRPHVTANPLSNSSIVVPKNLNRVLYTQPVIQGSGIQGLLVKIWPKIRVELAI